MSKQQMSLQTTWDDPEALIEHLASEAYLGRLTTLVGAGISQPLGLPSWPRLVQACEKKKNATPTDGFDLARRAEILLRKHYDSDENAFALAVREELYAGVNADLWSLRDNRTLSAIAALSQAAASTTSAARVITLNFDDLLETYLRMHGCPTVSIVAPDGAEPYAPVHVLHPHGLLPFADAKVGGSLVFHKQSFAQIISDRDGWQAKLIEAMRGKTCLFVGTSMLDDHFEVLFNRVNEMRRLAKASEPTYWGVWMTAKDASTGDTATLLEARGIHTLQVANYEEELPKLLFTICAAVGEFNSRMA